MKKRVFKNIYKQIKRHNNIVIVRHIGADPDALGSQLALRDSIRNTFPKKNVYALGISASRFRYIGTLDKISDENYDKIISSSLLIVLDTPDKKRVDITNIDKYKTKIKIDHHPFVEEFCNIEWIQDKASSTCEMVIELIKNTKLKLTKEIAEKLYLGLVSDTNRFLFSYTSPKTFHLVAYLIEKTNIDIIKLYEMLYLRPLKEIKFEGYIADNLTVTENGLAYIKLKAETLEKYNVDPGTAGTMINDFNYIEEALVWVTFTEDKTNNNIRGSIRSRGPVINDIAAYFGGGGHKYASGVKFKDFDDTEALIKKLDETCLKYKEGL